jgi:hypothetical protein
MKRKNQLDNKEEFIDSPEHLITFNYSKKALKYASDCLNEEIFYETMRRDSLRLRQITIVNVIAVGPDARARAYRDASSAIKI